MIKILFKGIMPERKSDLASGWDIKASKETYISPGCVSLVDTDLYIAVPKGYEAQVRSRSGLTLKHSIWVANAPGTIDADYRGEVKVMLYNGGQVLFDIKIGDRIAQLVIAPVCHDISFEICSELPATIRGEGGFGSTGISEFILCFDCGISLYKNEMVLDNPRQPRCVECWKIFQEKQL